MPRCPHYQLGRRPARGAQPAVRTAAGRRRRTFILRYTEDGTAWNGKNSVAADDFLSLAPPPAWTSRLSAPTLMLMGHHPPQSLAGMSAAEIAGVVRGGGARL